MPSFALIHGCDIDSVNVERVAKMGCMVASGTIARQFLCMQTNFVLELINYFCGDTKMKMVKSVG